MVGVSFSQQFRAVAWMRWRMLAHSLRAARGRVELGARVISQLFFAALGLGLGAGLGFAAWQMASHGHWSLLPLLLWPVLVLWQMIPILLTSFQEQVDLSLLLRFPVSFRSYMLLYLAFGLIDLASILGFLAVLGLWIGLIVARPGLILWSGLALLLFAAFNILLSRMIFAWLDRWLRQRKTREILGLVFLFLLLAAQLLNPAFHTHSGHPSMLSQPVLQQRLSTVDRVQRPLPPGLAAGALSDFAAGKPVQGVADLLFLALYGAAAAALLGVRLGAEFRGENLGDGPRRASAVSRTETHGPRFSLGSGSVAAVMVKEFNYLRRSGVVLYGMLAPLAIVFLFTGARGASSMGFNSEYALPIAVVYSFLGLTRLVYNNLGAEGAGVQLYFLSPTPFRKVLLAKNLLHLLLFCVELVFVCSILAFRVGLPGPRMILLTACWLLFAIPAQLAVGNILSLTMAYRMNLTRMSREQGAVGNGLASVLAQLVIFAVMPAVYFPCSRVGHPMLAVPILLVLAAGAIFFWLRILGNASDLANARRETLIAVLYRAA